MTPTDAVYVYGVVPKGTSAGVFARVSGIDPAGEIRLVEDDDVAAITSAVPLEEFGLQALEANLRDPDWLEQKVQAHNQVLAAGVGETTVVPFRFGAIYNGEEQVRTMLSQRAELAGTLTRLRGALEFGVKGFLDGAALRERLSRSAGVGAGEAEGGLEYMQRKRLEQQLEGDVRKFAASCAEASHDRLAAVASEARANPPQPPEVAGGEMLLNGAYLVGADREADFRGALQELQHRFREDGVRYELTGPWPPYNFVDEEVADAS